MTDTDGPDRQRTPGTRAGRRVYGPPSPRAVPRPGAEPLTMAKSVGDLDWRRAVVVALVAATFAFLGTYTVGTIGDAKGYQLLETIKPTTRAVCFTAISASVTILALMMTGLSIGRGWHHDFRPEHYDRVRQIAFLSTLSIVVSVFLLLFLNIPIQEAESFERWYSFIYYGVTITSSIIGGLLISTTFLLYNAVAVFILAIDPHVDASDVLEDMSPPSE